MLRLPYGLGIDKRSSGCCRGTHPQGRFRPESFWRRSLEHLPVQVAGRGNGEQVAGLRNIAPWCLLFAWQGRSVGNT